MNTITLCLCMNYVDLYEIGQRHCVSSEKVMAILKDAGAVVVDKDDTKTLFPMNVYLRNEGELVAFVKEYSEGVKAILREAAQEVPALSDERVRAEFEIYARKKDYDLRMSENLKGEYANEVIQFRFEGWQARALLAASQPVQREARMLTQAEVMQAADAYDHKRHTYDCDPFLELFCEVNGIPLKADAAGGEKSNG